MLDHKALAVDVLSGEVAVELFDLLLDLGVVERIVTGNIQDLQAELIVGKDVVDLQVDVVAGHPLAPTLGLDGLDQQSVIQVGGVIAQTVVDQDLLGGAELEVGAGLLGAILRSDVGGGHVRWDVLEQRRVVQVVGVVLLQTHTVALGHIGKLASVLEVVVANLLRPAGKGAGLADDEGGHGASALLELGLQLRDELLVLVGGGQAAIGLLGADLICNLGQIVLAAILLKIVDEVDRAAKHHVERDDLTDLIGVLGRIHHQQVETGLHVGDKGLASELHSLILGQVGVALLVALPRAAVVAAQVVRAGVANLVGDLLDVGGKARLVPTVHVAGAHLVHIDLVAAGDEHGRKVLIAGKLEHGLDQIGAHGANADHGCVIAAVLQLEHALNGLADGEIGHFVLLLLRIIDKSSLGPGFEPFQCGWILLFRGGCAESNPALRATGVL